MNLKFIDRVIKAYEADLPEGDMKRLKFFYGMWEDMDRWSKGPTTADKHYAVPSEEVLEEAWIADKPVFSFAPAKLSKERFCAICYSLREYVCDEGLLSEEDSAALHEVNFRTLIEQADMELAATDPEAFIGSLLSNAYEQEIPATAAHMVALVGMLALRVDLELVAKAVLKKQRRINKMNHNPQKCPVCGGTPALAKVGGESPTDGRVVPCIANNAALNGRSSASAVRVVVHRTLSIFITSTLRVTMPIAFTSAMNATAIFARCSSRMLCVRSLTRSRKW